MTFNHSKDFSSELKTFELDPEKGIINIGSHETNDIVLDVPGLRPFHLMLDYRQKPFRVMPLDPQADIEISGARISGTQAQDVVDLNQVAFCGYSFFIDDNENGSRLSNISIIQSSDNYVPSAAPSGVAPSVRARRPGGAVSSTAAPLPAVSAGDTSAQRTDDYILVELGEVQDTIDVEQTAVYPLTVINAGPIVATFDISVEGVPEEWIQIHPDRLNLNEGGRSGAEIHITPPRASTSRAGEYPLVIRVLSHNYHGHMGQVTSKLTVNPYYEFSVGNLTPRSSAASWRKRSSVVNFPIGNMGNSSAKYLLSAQDEETKCQFEFQMQDQANLVRQAEVQIEPGETVQQPIQVSPLKRSLVRLRAKRHQYSVSTQSLDDNVSLRTISGSFVARPLFGILSILLLAIMLIVGAYFLLRPRILDFNISEDVIEAGESISLNWKVSPFTTDLRIDGINDEITGSQNQIEIFPDDTVNTYTLVAGNWLSRMLRMEDIRSQRETLLVIPPTPVISTFFVDQTEIFQGDDITVKWSVREADEVFLTVEGVRNALKEEEFNGERTVTLRSDSLVILEAVNSSGTTIQSEFIHAQKPSIRIDEFTLSKTTITEGEPVTIRWKVGGTGVENVMIAPFTEVYPLQGELTFFPEESMEFVLTIKNRDLEEIRLLPVGVLPPGAEPEAPSIEIFEVAPAEVTGSGTVEFSWVISGEMDNAEITNLEGVVLGSMPAQGFKAIEVAKTTSFILTAYNGDLSSAKIKDVTVSETKKDVQVEITQIIPATAVKRGESVLVYTEVEPLQDGVPVEPIDVDWPELSGTVVVTDGFDTCTVTLPQKSCELTFNTSEDSKSITGTYSGDDNYVRRTSDPYALGYAVVGEPVVFDAVSPSSPQTIVVGESITVTYNLSPQDPAASSGVTGIVKVMEGEGENEVVYCDNTLQLDAADATSAHGSCVLDFEEPGIRSLTVKYMGNEIYQGEVTHTAQITVNKPETTAAFSGDVTSIHTVTGQPFSVNFSVSVVAPGQGLPTGSVVISDQDNPSDYCEGTLTGSGTGNCELTLNEAGSRTILAEYSGDSTFQPSPAASAIHSVDKASTTVIIDAITNSTYPQVGQNIIVSVDADIALPGTGDLSGEIVLVSLSSTESCDAILNVDGQGQCEILLRSRGYRTVAAVFQSSERFNQSAPASDNYNVNSAETEVVISGHVPSPSAVNTMVTFEATVDTILSSVLTPDGIVEIRDQVTGQSCTIANYPSQTSCSIIFTSEGTKQMLARYLGTDQYLNSVSDIVTHNVKKGTLTTIMTDVPDPSQIDQDVQVQVTVASITGGTTPTGTVTVTVNTGESGSCSLSGSGVAYCTLNFTTAGTKLLTATYNGDDLYTGSVSVSESHTVAQAVTTTTIRDYTNPIEVGASNTIRFRVESSHGTPDGNVTVTADTGETCSSALVSGEGTCQMAILQGGTNNLTADYDGGDGTRFAISSSGANALTVDPAATNLTILSHNPDPSDVGESITVNYRVRSVVAPTTIYPTSGTDVVTVTLEDSSTLCTGDIGSNGEGSCSASIDAVGDGTNTLTVSYAGDTDFAASSHTADHDVELANTSVVINSRDPGSTSVVGEEVVFHCEVTVDPPGGGVPTGTLTIIASQDQDFNDDDNIEDSATINASGLADLALTFEEADTWNVRVSYDGDSNYNVFETSTFTQTVERGTTVTTILIPSPPPPLTSSELDMDINFQVRVAIQSPADGELTGQVVVTIDKGGAFLERTCTDSSLAMGAGFGIAECSINMDVRGDFTVSAQYNSDPNFRNDTSNSQTHSVNGIDTITSITSGGITPSSPSLYDTTVRVPFTVTPDSESIENTDRVEVTASKSGESDIIHTASISTGYADFDFPSAGIWALSARYLGGDRHDVSTSVSVSHTVHNQTTTTMGNHSDSEIEGTYVSFNFDVAGQTGSGYPGGVVSVIASKSGSSNLQCDDTLSDGHGTCMILFGNGTAGEWTIQANYQGEEPLWHESSSATSTLHIQYPTTTTMGGHSSSVSANNSVTFNFSVVSQSGEGGTPGGDVRVVATHNILSNLVCTDTLNSGNGSGSCTILFGAGSVGDWTIRAYYQGTTEWEVSESGSSTVTVIP